MNMKKLLLDKRGAMSIWYVILLLMATLVMAGFVDILRQSYSMNEVQSVMDTAGVAALTSNVRTEELKKWERYYKTKQYGDVSTSPKPDIEKFVNKRGVEGTFKTLVKEDLSKLNTIDDVDYLRVKTENFESNYGLGQSSRSLPQSTIDTTVLVRVDSTPIFDLFPAMAKDFYDSRSNEEFTVSYIGETQDGKTELAIRSFSRVIYNNKQ